MKGISMFLSAVLLSSCAVKRNEKSAVSEAAQKQELKAVSDLHSVKFKKLKGHLWFEEKKEGILVRVNVKGLPRNKKFGLHIHEKGICEGPQYKSAGEHFNPTNQKHGGIKTPERHLGDMENLVSDKLGNAKTEFLLPPGLEDFIGKAVIVHAKPDDLKSQPSGGAGDRIACGLVKPSDFVPQD
jgi:superoxide dismutase, Cu-Zn family